ncbi:MAG: hypothetical protein J6X05_04635, partial [Bacteroidales bacterium]|nr:hypothetical protein [Bacteroidales bacterium]
MKKYQSNIFRQTVSMLLMVLAVMCANVAFAQTYTLTSSQGTKVSNDVSSVVITASGFGANDGARYALYDGVTSTCIGEHSAISNGTISWTIQLKEGNNQIKIYKTKNNSNTTDGNSHGTLTVYRMYATPPTPTGNEKFTVNGGSDGKLDFASASNGTININIAYTGLNPNAVYYLIKSSDSNQSNTSRSITPNSNGEASSNPSAKDGIDLILKIDNGSGLPGQIVSVMHLSQYYPPTLIVNPSSTVCSGGEVVIFAKNIGETYDQSDWTVTGGTATPDYDDANHTLTLSNVSAGNYVVTLKLKNGETLTATFTAVDATPMDRTISGCWDQLQLNATLPDGFTGSWDGDGVVSKNDPATFINNPNGLYVWTVNNGSCSFQEKWTVTNGATGLSDIVVTQTGDCGSATLSVSHNKGVTVKWTVDDVEKSATSSGDTKSSITLTEAGNHSVKVTAGTGGSCPSEKYTSVAVSSLEGFDTTPEEVIVCTGNSTQLGPAPIVAGASKSYWTPSGSSFTITPNESSNTVTVSGLTEGSTSTMTWTVEKDACKASKVYTIKNGTATVTGSDDRLVCGSANSAPIGINYPGEKAVRWVNLTTNEVLDVDKPRQITVTGLPEGTTTFRAYVYDKVFSYDENNNEKVAYGCVTDKNNFKGPGVAYTDIKVTRVVATASALPNSVCSTTETVTLSGSPLSKAGPGAT